MTTSELLNTTLKTLGYPVARLIFKGTANTYFTFQHVVSIPDLYADDDNVIVNCTFRVDLYSKNNYEELLKNTICTLKSAGFKISSIDADYYEEDTGYFHIPITIKYLEV